MGLADQSQGLRRRGTLPKRFARYGLTLHAEKTRLVEFGRAALARAIRAGTKPNTFDFLGLTHKCALGRREGSSRFMSRR